MAGQKGAFLGEWGKEPGVEEQKAEKEITI